MNTLVLWNFIKEFNFAFSYIVVTLALCEIAELIDRKKKDIISNRYGCDICLKGKLFGEYFSLKKKWNFSMLDLSCKHSIATLSKYHFAYCIIVVCQINFKLIFQYTLKICVVFCVSLYNGQTFCLVHGNILNIHY